MASLRTLLDVPNSGDVPVPTFVGENAHQLWFRGNHCWEYSSAEDYGRQCFCWDVPSRCVCKVVFEIWGGGGGGSGACCCSNGVPAHSGQYTKCTVCALSPQVTGTSLDGFRYCLYVASGTCRYPVQNSAYDGCKSYITGCGLDNFCACGGCYGGSFCFGGGNAGACNTFPVACCGTSWASCRWQTDKYNRPDCTSYRAVQTCCETFGKDFWGNGVSYNQFDYSDCGNWCHMKNYRPSSARFAGGVMGAKFGALHVIKHVQMFGCGRDLTLFNTGNSGGLSSDCFRNGPPGAGGMSADTYGGGCCCGSEGAHGLIRLTWYCKT